MNKSCDINNLNWGNLLLSELSLEGENISIKIKQNNDYKIINCEEFIGIKYLGEWEDSFIDSITVERNGDLIIESIKNIKNYRILKNTYYSNNIYEPWVQLNIKFIDGCFIKIACKSTNLLQ